MSDAHIVRAQACIRHAFERYGPAGVALGFNGGKDCTVLLDLALAVRPVAWPPLRLVHVTVPSDTFAELDAFVAAVPARYPGRVVLHRYADPLPIAFARFLADVRRTEHVAVHAVLVGVRRTDPHGAQLEPVQPTDNGWPAFVRIHPLLEWTYADVWQYLLLRRVPYCPLYDRGYTSLGVPSRTTPNPHLALSDGRYLCASELQDATAERAGRH